LSSPPPLYAEVQRRLELFIRDRGLKQTRQRDEILEVFLGAESHLSVEELLRLVQVRMPGVGHATVYRTMKLLVDAGIAHEQQFRDGQLRYEPVIPNEHHDHLICLDCKRIFEFEDPVIEERQSQVAATHGLRLRSHRHEIYGSCNNPDSCPHRLAAP
jgi:Fur family ferric uptake transcriptional regulator